MMETVLLLPDQFEIGAAWALDFGSEHRGEVDRVLICGMGGSAFPGDLVAVHAQSVGLEVRIHRDYDLSRCVLGTRTLVIASSYSGETEETLSAYEDARRRGLRVVALGSGGELQRRALEHGVPFVRLQKPSAHFQPRAAMGYFFGALLRVLQNAGLLTDVDPLLTHIAGALRRDTTAAVTAAALRDALRDRIPVIYAPHPFAETAARIAKIKLNENAKMPAFYAALPELNHNELVGFTSLTGPFSAVLLRPCRQEPAMLRRFEVTAETLVDVGVPVTIVNLLDDLDIVAIFGVLHAFDIASVELAIDAGIDPTPVALVEDFKRRLSARLAARVAV